MTQSSRLYTRLGDDGKTYCLISGTRVEKHHPCIEFMGVLDEAESWLGFASSLLTNTGLEEARRDLDWMQQLLFRIGFSMSGTSCVDSGDVDRLEKIVDRYSSALRPLFTLNGGHPAAAAISVARTVVRRLERRLSYCIANGLLGEEHRVFLAVVNRMSDALYAMSIWVNRELGVEVEHVEACRKKD